MAVHYKTCGLVLRRSDIAEADRIFKVFTKDFGKIEILGKAIRKIASKLKGGMDVFFLSEIEFIQGKTYKTLTEAFSLERFKNIKTDTDKLKIAYKAAETFDVLVGGQEQDETLWEFVNKFFLKLEKEELDKRSYYLFYNYFAWNLFCLLGYKPELYKCVVCGGKLNPAYVYFSSEDGGTLCSNCGSGKRRISADVVKIIRLILQDRWDILSKLKVKPFSKKLTNDTTKDYYLYLLPKKDDNN